MSRRDRLVPAIAFVLLASLGLLVLVLVTDAANSGRRALEQSLLAEVQAIARSQNARVESQLEGIRGLAGQDWELEPRSERDQAALEDLFDLVRDSVRSGFYLTDEEGVITAGVNFVEPAVGARVDRPGVAEALEPDDPGRGGRYVPVQDEGFTTDVPNVALVFPIGPPGGPPRGLFVFESEVVTDSAFNEEIAQLRRGETGEFSVFGPRGRVVASNDPSALARPVSEEMAQAPDGLHHIGDDVVALADIPAADWRIAFRQERDEFEEGLTGPLQRVGTIIVVVFVFVGVVSFLALSRRLRVAREEQDRLRRLSASQEEFISIVSHELRTPVAGVLGFLQTTIDHWDAMTDAERSGAVLRAASNARRLQGLTRDVLDSQSVESGRMTYAMAPADLREEVEVAADSARALYPAQRFETVFHVDEARVRMDVDRIQQVLTNLIDNAVRVSPPDVPIELRLWTEAGTARVSVLDHGPGLPPDMIDRVFEKFVRGRSGTVTGTGLGLYIARRILEAHDGSISADSRPGEGAVFTVELPLMEDAVAR